MPLVPALLGSGLANMSPTMQEAVAIQNFADAFANYFALASVGGVPALPGSLSGAKSTMIGAMSGLSASGGAAAAITTGITAFWGVVAASSATIWPAAPAFPAVSATPPPGLAGIAGALNGVFAANKAGNLALAAAANAVATAIHSTQLGGIAIVATVPVPTPSPIL